MKLLRITSGIALVLAAATLLFAQADTALQKAIRKETVEGDLKGAIEQYKKLAQGSNRATAAQALIHMGECYEKLGSKEARAQYELVISKFADQKDAVAQARARMTAFPTGSKGPTLTQVCAWDCWNRISPDGRWTLYQRTDGVAIRDNAAGGSMRLLVEGAVCCWEFSPDSTRVAYATRNPRQTFVVNVDGSAKRMIADSGGPMAWSSDGVRLLIAQYEGNLGRLSWVRVADGMIQQLPTSRRNLDSANVSPDGRWIALNASADAKGDLEENVFLMAADGSGETRVSESPLYQEPIGWSSDGSHLFYAQFGTSPSLWAVPVANGHLQGPAVALRQFNTGVQFLAMTATGTLYYRERVSGGDVYTASMDPVSGKVTSIPVPVPLTTMGAPFVWSPDSRRLAHFGKVPHGEIRVFSPQGGKDLRVPMQSAPVNSLCWPRGSNTILTNINTPATPGPNRTPARFDSIRVDLTTGESQQVFPGASSFRLWDCTDTLATNDDGDAVKVRNLQTGAETELYRLKRPTANYGMSRISPDGRAVAFLELLDSDTVVLLTVPTAGGPARELTRTKAFQLQNVDGHSWSHDSRYVYFFRRANANAPYELYRIPATGGPEENMGLQSMELRDLHISPDGTKIAFNNGSFQRPEIWALDNFMPSAK